jgi:hypothetical protein
MELSASWLRCLATFQLSSRADLRSPIKHALKVETRNWILQLHTSSLTPLDDINVLRCYF